MTNVLHANSEIEKHTNEDGSTNWGKLEAGECREYFRFERIGQIGYGAIQFQSGKWSAYAWNGTAGKTQELTRDSAIATIAKIKASAAYKVIHDFSANI